ncbi:hypothetical protein DEDE109153_15395 [Deinococcus deserti]
MTAVAHFPQVLGTTSFAALYIALPAMGAVALLMVYWECAYTLTVNDMGGFTVWQLRKLSEPGPYSGW